jgi:DsbC/DsbD-like thiol-disulfide interchange protein
MNNHFLPSAKSFAVAIVLVSLGIVPAGAAVGSWVGDSKARVRLLAAGVDASGRLAAGVEIEVDPGWHTYWRSPGDSGIAPALDFSGSRNLGPVDVAFPLPTRLDDGTSVVNIYEGRVVLPLAATVADRAAAADLTVKVDLGVCADVCVPQHFEATLSLAPGTTDAEAEKLLGEARRRLPGAPEPGVFAVTAATRQGGTDKRPSFDIAMIVPDASRSEVFVEGPDDWYPDVPKPVSHDAGKVVYRVTFDRLTSKVPIAGTKLRVTVISAGQAIEQWVPLD